MIGYIKDAIQSGLYQDFWGEDSLLVDGFHECYGEQLTCEGFCAYPSSTDDNVVYVDIGGGFSSQIQDNNRGGLN